MATLKNTTINDTGHITVAKGTTGERPVTPTQGMLRYNTTTNVLETYTSTNAWGGLEPPPAVSSVSGIINTDTNTTITVSGANFLTGAIVNVTGTGVPNSPRALTTTFVNTTTLTAATDAQTSNYTGGGAYSVFVVNPSGNTSTTLSVGFIDRDAVWVTASGSLATVFDSQRSGFSVTVSATDPDGTVVYNLESGSLPPGTSLNTSTGVISGTPTAVGSDTTSSFTLGATDAAGLKTLRAFSITVKAPVVTSFTATGSSSFSVPTGVTAVRVIAIGGGGGGGRAGGGGGGGMIDHPSFPVTPGGSIPLNIGGGGTGTQTDGIAPNNGDDTVFGTLTAKGGGRGSWSASSSGPGGSGGGAAFNSPGNAGGTATQPTQPGASGTFGFGSNGGTGGGGTNNSGGGGGGAGGVGGPGDAWPVGPGGGTFGGDGRTSDITGSSVTYAGGGAGAGHPPAPFPGNPGGGGASFRSANNPTSNGVTNKGGGGGGQHGGPNGPPGVFGGGFGGSGIIVVRF
jgi:hypothetical protein